MVDSVVGSVIMVVATTSLLFAIEVAEQAFDQAGRYPLNADEEAVLKSVGIIEDEEVEEFWRVNLFTAPREVGVDE